MAFEVGLDQSVPDSTIVEQLKAQAEILDAMGIYQHHDAVSGTAKQRVADDYAKRLDDAMKLGKDAYSKFVGHQV